MNRISLKASQNIYSDSQTISKENLDLEQSFNNTVQSGIIQNHIGSGILRDTLTQNVLFDSGVYLSSYPSIDGVGITTGFTQPSDSSLGNQLEIALSGTLASRNRTIKVGLFGYDLNGTLFYETFRFRKNESQITTRHYTLIKCILINDFDGGYVLEGRGKIQILEAKPVFSSRDVISLAQNQEPQTWFRDFKPSVSYANLTALLNAAMPSDSWSTLFSTTSSDITITAGDTVTQVGQKFLATSANIQKIRVLLKTNTAGAFGTVSLSLYSLQTKVTNSTDFVPDLGIEYDPDSIPLAQASLTLTLNTTYQPVDFFFNNSTLGSKITVGNYYIFVIKVTSVATLNLSIANSTQKWLSASSSRVSIFAQVGTTSEGTWTDNATTDLWFEIYSNAIKTTSGQFYENGYGTSIDKSRSGSDYAYNQITSSYFKPSQQLKIVGSVVSTASNPQPDPRTGQEVNTSQEYDPSISLVTASNFSTLTSPLVLGQVVDTNTNASASSFTLSSFHNLFFFNNEIYIYQNHLHPVSSFNLLHSWILNNDVVNATLTIGTSTYIVDKAETFCSVIGDANQDGVVDMVDDAAVTQISAASGVAWSPVPSTVYPLPIYTPPGGSPVQISIPALLSLDIDSTQTVSATSALDIANFVMRASGYLTEIGQQAQMIKFTVSASTDTRDDDAVAGIHTTPNLLADSNIAGYATSAITLSFHTDTTWKETNLSVFNLEPFVTTVFSSTDTLCTPCEVVPQQRVDLQSLTGQKTDLYIPHSLILGQNAALLNEDSSFYKVDFEIGTVTFELPTTTNTNEVSINVFTSFVAESEPCSGVTALAFPAMRFADGSFVDLLALEKDQVRFGISITSYVPQANSLTDYVGASFDPASGTLRLAFNSLNTVSQPTDSVLSKIQMTAYLKKAGFNNIPLTLTNAQVENLLTNNSVIIPTLPQCVACQTRNISEVSLASTLTYTALPTDAVIEVTASASGSTIDLKNIESTGREISVFNNTANSITILDSTPANMNGASSFTNNAMEANTFVFDGTKWITTSNYNIASGGGGGSTTIGLDLVNVGSSGQHVIGISGNSSNLVNVAATIFQTTSYWTIQPVNVSSLSTLTLDTGSSTTSTSQDILNLTGQGYIFSTGTKPTGITTIVGGAVNINGGEVNATVTGAGANFVAGSVNLTGGNAVVTGTDTCAGGSINLLTGGAQLADGTPQNTGSINLYTQDADTGETDISTGSSGYISIQTGISANSGGIAIVTGNTYTFPNFSPTNPSSVSGSITLQTGSGGEGTGITLSTQGTLTSDAGITLQCGTCANGVGGPIVLQAGSSGTSTGGLISLTGGTPTQGDGGAINITAGNGATTGADVTGGAVNITSGNGVGNPGGNIVLLCGSSNGATGGNVEITGGAASSNAGGSIYVTSGSGLVSGNVSVSTAVSVPSYSGQIDIFTGDCTGAGSGPGPSNQSGIISLATGTAYTTGNLYLNTGDAQGAETATSGYIKIATGTVTITDTSPPPPGAIVGSIVLQTGTSYVSRTFSGIENPYTESSTYAKNLFLGVPYDSTADGPGGQIYLVPSPSSSTVAYAVMDPAGFAVGTFSTISHTTTSLFSVNSSYVKNDIGLRETSIVYITSSSTPAYSLGYSERYIVYSWTYSGSASLPLPAGSADMDGRVLTVKTINTAQVIVNGNIDGVSSATHTLYGAASPTTMTFMYSNTLSTWLITGSF